MVWLWLWVLHFFPHYMRRFLSIGFQDLSYCGL
jgi:hypothetical protein